MTRIAQNVLASVVSWLTLTIFVWGAVRGSLAALVLGGVCCAASIGLELLLIRRRLAERRAASG